VAEGLAVQQEQLAHHALAALADYMVVARRGDNVVLPVLALEALFVLFGPVVPANSPQLV